MLNSNSLRTKKAIMSALGSSEKNKRLSNSSVLASSKRILKVREEKNSAQASTRQVFRDLTNQNKNQSGLSNEKKKFVEDVETPSEPKVEGRIAKNYVMSPFSLLF